MNVIQFPSRKSKQTMHADLYEQLLEAEEIIEELETKIARKEKWLYSGLLKSQKELYERYQRELEDLQKERVKAEIRKKDVIMKLMEKEKK